MTDEANNTEKETQPQAVPSETELDSIKEQLKKQILSELQDEQTRKMEQAKARRLEEKAEKEEFIEKMKNSPDPWVDIMGWVHTDEGVRIELEWNDAFVDFLRAEGVTGTDEDQIIQKWVTLLLRDMADQMEDRHGSEFEG